MLRISNVDHFNKVVGDISLQDNWEELIEKLEAQLKYLNEYNPERFDVEIGYDFAVWSFSVVWIVKESSQPPFMYGGLIYHSYSEDWSVHT